MMNTCFRTIFLAVLFSLYLINPGSLRTNTVSCSHASKIDYSAEESPKPDSLNENLFRSKIHAVQVTACLEEKNAWDLAKRLRDKGYTPGVYSLKDSSGNLWHVVFLGVYEKPSEAGCVARQYREEEGNPAFVKSFNPSVLEESRVKETSPDGFRDRDLDHDDVEKRLPGLGKITEPVHGENIPEELSGDGTEEDAGETGEEDLEDGEKYEENIAEFTYSGFIELESFVNTYKDQDFRDANKKNEIRNRLEIKYGTEKFFLFAVSNIYLFQTYLNEDAKEDYVYSREHRVSRNLRISSKESELRFDELYINYTMGNFRLRMGNQIYGWGTADAFNPTSYFNPHDLRELIFKDDDENKAGVPSISGMFFLGDYTLETVFVPVHIPIAMPPNGNFWSFVIDDHFFPVVFEEPRELDADISNCGYGARLSTSLGGVDMSVSGYHGPDREPVFLPYKTLILPNEPVAVLIKPKSYVVSMFGADFSATLGDFVMQVEAAYSPDKRGLVRQNFGDYENMKLPLQVDKSQYMSYSIGFNYFIPINKLIDGHEGESVFTFEWFQSKYFNSDLYPPFLTDIITCRFEDSYFDGRIKTKISAIFDTKNGGTIFWPEVGYDFQNGFSVELSYAAIWGKGESTRENNSVFYYFRDNDILMGKVRYEY